MSPRPTVSLTLAPFLSFCPGLGLWASTWFLRALLERLKVTMPRLQWAFLIFATALASSSPTTLGTWHFGRPPLHQTKPPRTVRSRSIVTSQAPSPLQLSPPQPEKFQPEADVAVKVTAVPSANWAEQASGQSIPAGELVTPGAAVSAPRVSREEVDLASMNVKDSCTVSVCVVVRAFAGTATVAAAGELITKAASRPSATLGA